MTGSRVAMVTGGGTGIGQAIAAALVARGYRVALLGRRRNVLEEAAAAIDPDGASVLVVPCDVSESGSVDEAVRQVTETAGGLDLYVNNAGVLTPASIARTDDETWSAMLGANLGGTFFSTRAAMAWMREHGGGVVVNVASMLGGVAVAGFGAYGATKAGIIQLTKVAALEGARYGIRVNAVMPGYVETAMSEAAQEDPALMEQLIARIPAGRFAKPEEIAAAVMYLASDEAAYVTGTTLLIDGGYSLRP